MRFLYLLLMCCALPVFATKLPNIVLIMADDLGYGEGYRYDHAEADAYAAGERYFPDEMHDEQFYFPTDRGLEQKIRERMATLRARDEHARDKISD